jgi:hypothetical protein
MMFMISGRATNENGSPIVRDGVVAAIHEAGHSVVTSAPRRGSYAYVDYLVATNASITNRVSKVRWANDRGISVITYLQMWRLIHHGEQPTPVTLPIDMSPPIRRTTMADVHRQEADVPEPTRLEREQAERALAVEIEQHRRQRAARQRDQESAREAAANAPPPKSEVAREVAAETGTPVVNLGKPRRKIVTRR